MKDEKETRKPRRPGRRGTGKGVLIKGMTKRLPYEILAEPKPPRVTLLAGGRRMAAPRAMERRRYCSSGEGLLGRTSEEEECRTG